MPHVYRAEARRSQRSGVLRSEEQLELVEGGLLLGHELSQLADTGVDGRRWVGGRRFLARREEEVGQVAGEGSEDPHPDDDDQRAAESTAVGDWVPVAVAD